MARIPLNEERVILSPLYADRIKGLHDDKMAINDKKNRLGLSHNSDDWGFVWFEDFHFEPPKFREDDLVFGCKTRLDYDIILVEETCFYIIPEGFPIYNFKYN